MKELSSRQQDILDFIGTFTDERSYPPTIREIQEGLSISSTSVVDYNLKVPEQRTLLRQSVQEVEGEQRQRQREEDQRVKLECRRRGIQIFELNDQEINEFVETCQPLYEEYCKLRGPDLVEAIRKTRPERPSKPSSPGGTPSRT